MAISRRWLKIGSGSAFGVTTIIGLFMLLMNLYGFEITATDDVCEGTLLDPCISYITVRNPNLFNVDIYNQNEVKLEFAPNIPEYYLFVKDGRCKGGVSCASPNGVSLPGWKFIDFTEATKPLNSTKYVFRFPARTTKEFLLWGLKNDPKEEIKWTFGTPKGELDPYWYPEQKILNVSLENKQEFHNWSDEQLKWFMNETCEWNEGNSSWSSCPYQKLVTVNHSDLVKEWQELTINGVVRDVSSWNVWCWDNEEENKVYCKSTLDGDGKYKQEGVKAGMSYFYVSYADSVIFYTNDHYGEFYLNKLQEMIS